MVRHRIALAPLLFAAASIAQTPTAKPVPPLQTHQLNADGSVTFRYSAPNAVKVELSLDFPIKPTLTMTRDAVGTWSATTPPLPPEYYHYTFAVDGAQMLDPRNADIVHSITGYSDTVFVPASTYGKQPMAWEFTNIPHGTLARHLYATQIMKNLPQGQEAYIVYTPPGYDAHKAGGYPVFYLLHGWSDAEDGWTEVGQANLILDSLLATGKIVPMIVVMPLGYGDYNFVTHHFSVWNDPVQVSSNTSLFEQGLLQEIVPAVEHEYNIAPGRQNHAIAGLSMGGLESVTIGLDHPEQFAWVGGLSSAVFDTDFAKYRPGYDGKKANFSLFWIACGTEDQLIKSNRELVAWAGKHGLPVTPIEIPGAHTWLTWRDNLIHLAPLLFQPKQ